MTPHGPGVVQKDARILLDPRPVFRFVQVQVISGVGGFPSSIVGTDTGTGTSTGSFSVNFS